MTSSKNEKKPKIIQSVERSIKVLDFIADTMVYESSEGVTFSEICKHMDLSKSTVFGFLSTLEHYDYISKNTSTHKYTLGTKLFELGQIYHNNLDIRKIAQPLIAELSSIVNETVHLAILSNDEIIYIDKIDSPHSIGMISKIGRRNYVHCTGVGKSIISEMDDTQLNRIIENKGLPKLTDHTLHTLDTLKENLALIRTRGYSFDKEEIELGLHCIAAPIRNHQGQIVAAVSIAAPTSRITFEQLTAFKDDLLATVHRISLQLGYRK